MNLNEFKLKMSEKFSLKWYDYQLNWNKSLKELQKDTDFADVTLISDDKIKFSAHRILLSSCSNLFKLILKGNVQANSLLYLSGVNSYYLGFILDYIYHGEVNIYQEQLDSFLESAQKLEIEGLLSDTKDGLENLNKENHDPRDHYAQDEDKSLVRMDSELNKIRPNTRAPKDAAMIDVGSMNTGEVDKKMRELYERTDEGWRCLVGDHSNKCQRSSNIRAHVETHLNGLMLPLWSWIALGKIVFRAKELLKRCLPFLLRLHLGA